MNMMKKFMKKSEGFTLVELIVVIAILAILAGVAVPAYTGYISKANEATDYSMLDSVKTAVFFAAIEEDEGHDAVVTKIVVTENSTTVTIEADNSDLTSVNISDYVSGITFKSDATGAEWTATAGEWTLTE